jgi:hypothetical protein
MVGPSSWGVADAPETTNDCHDQVTALSHHPSGPLHRYFDLGLGAASCAPSRQG